MQQKSNITYQGSEYSFQCSEDSWNLYKEIIKAWCDGESVEMLGHNGNYKPVITIAEDFLYYYRVKPKEYSKSYPHVGEVWYSEGHGYFVICKDTDKTGQVFWIEHSMVSFGGFNYKQIVFDNHCDKVYDSLEDYFTEKNSEGLRHDN